MSGQPTRGNSRWATLISAVHDKHFLTQLSNYFMRRYFILTLSLLMCIVGFGQSIAPADIVAKVSGDFSKFELLNTFLLIALKANIILTTNG